MNRRLLRLALLIPAVLLLFGATVTQCQPPKSWGCASWSGGNNGSLSNYGSDSTKYELNTDAFNTSSGFSSTICGNNQVFYTDTNAPQWGPVQSYPSIKYRYDQSSWEGCCAGPPSWIGGSIRFNTIRSLTSSWNVSFDHTTNAQAAYDFWFRNNCGALGKTINGDLMIWVDTSASRGTGGGPVRNSNLVIDGRSTTLIQYGTPGTDVSETIYKFNTNAASGSVNLMAFINAEISNGDLKACDSRGLMVGNADFGYEVAGTHGTSRFSVNDFHFHLTTTDGTDHQ